MVALSLWKLVYFLDFCYSNVWQPCHYGRQFVVVILVIPMDGNLVIMQGSLLSRFFLLQWMVALSLWKVVCCQDYCYSSGWQPSHYGRQSAVEISLPQRIQPCHYGRQSVVDIFVTPMDGSLVIMEGSLLLIFPLLLLMVALSLWKVVCCRYFCYSNGWYPCHYGRFSVIEIFITLMDSSHVIM